MKNSADITTKVNRFGQSICGLNTVVLLRKSITAGNSRFAKAGVSCNYDKEVLNSRFVHLMKFSAESPRLRKAAKR